MKIFSDGYWDREMVLIYVWVSVFMTIGILGSAYVLALLDRYLAGLRTAPQ